VFKIPTVKLITPTPMLEAAALLNNVWDPILAVPATVDKTIVGSVM
jgi:hypothetical protein